MQKPKNIKKPSKGMAGKVADRGYEVGKKEIKKTEGQKRKESLKDELKSRREFKRYGVPKMKTKEAQTLETGKEIDKSIVPTSQYLEGRQIIKTDRKGNVKKEKTVAKNRPLTKLDSAIQRAIQAVSPNRQVGQGKISVQSDAPVKKIKDVKTFRKNGKGRMVNKTKY